MNSNDNPCRFKPVCRNCIKVVQSERPSMCDAIACPEFTMCPSCHLNRTLHSFDGRMICKVCILAETSTNPELAKQLVRNELKKQEATGKMTMPSLESLSSGNTYDHATPLPPRNVTITLPGIPPDELNPEERANYVARWEDYKGYYRNPSAYFTCHMLILTEINMSYLNRRLINTRGEANAEISRELQAGIQMRKMLNDQLPSKEAEDIIDDDKAINSIYEAYIKEKKLTRFGPVSRVFSSQAVALAPALYFKIDPAELLEKCGFRQIEIEEILPKIVDFHTNKTPQEVLEFFGFRLDEKYAMPFETKTVEELDFDDGTDE